MPSASATPSPRGLTRAHPGVDVTEMPLSDGGEGVLDILRRALGLKDIVLEVADPLGRPVKASYGLSADGSTALVEMATASGLQLLTQAERNPLLTSTFGTGQLLADAKRRGATKALLCIGGSATNDGGIGMAAALGWQFLDAAGQPVKPDGGHLQQIARIIPPAQLPFEKVEVLCDVTNPLYGPTGASAIYGPQKGGTTQSIAQLDAGLRHLAALVEQQSGRGGPGRNARRRRGRRSWFWRHGVPGRHAEARHRNGAGPGGFRRGGEESRPGDYGRRPYRRPEPAGQVDPGRQRHVDGYEQLWKLK